jgi:hypothetical protein
MKIFQTLSIRLAKFAWLGALAVMAVVSAPVVEGQVIVLGRVACTPFTKELTAVIPSTQSYELTVSSIDTLPGTVTVPLNKEMVGVPPSGVSVATALGYVTFKVAGNPVTSVTFTGPGQSVVVTVTLEIPVGAVAGDYGYKINTSGPTGIPLNDGATINAAVSAAGALTPPVVTISTPADGETISVSSLPTTVTVRYTATSTGTGATVIESSDVDVDGKATTLVSQSGLGDFSLVSESTYVISTIGSHAVTARATNKGGTVSDINTFRVVFSTPPAPPTVVINSPTPSTTYTYRTGDADVQVPFTFTAKSNYGGIRELTAKVDGVAAVFSPVGIGTLTATGSIMLPYRVGGSHTLDVATRDDYGSATATSSFSVVVIAPTPVISISAPTAGQIFTIPTGQTITNVPFAFVTTSNNGFFVDEVSAMLGTNAVSSISTTGLGTASASSSGTLTGLTAGTYTLTANGKSAGIPVTASVSFVVRGSVVPPSVVINTPPAGSSYVRVSGGPALSIPLTFTGTSNTPGGVITSLTASLGSTALAVTPTNLNTAVATGSATMSVTNAGTYTISVSAKDAFGTANATRTFTVTVVQGRSICGDTFFDVDSDGREDCEDFGLSGVTVRLTNSSGQIVGTAVTTSCGNYSFSNLAPGTYTVSVVAPTGLRVTTVSQRTAIISGCDVSVEKFGFGLDLNGIRGMVANGNSHGFWKANIDKAIKGQNGAQVTKTALEGYTRNIADFALSPYDNITMKTASSLLNYNGSNSSSLLSKQLIASEYNYQHKAYLNGNKTLTFVFLYWGEYVLKNTSRYTDADRLWAKDWFDAYNNTHGGAIVGPANR